MLGLRGGAEAGTGARPRGPQGSGGGLGLFARHAPAPLRNHNDGASQRPGQPRWSIVVASPGRIPVPTTLRGTKTSTQNQCLRPMRRFNLPSVRPSRTVGLSRGPARAHTDRPATAPELVREHAPGLVALAVGSRPLRGTPCASSSEPAVVTPVCRGMLGKRKERESSRVYAIVRCGGRAGKGRAGRCCHRPLASRPSLLEHYAAGPG